MPNSSREQQAGDREPRSPRGCHPTSGWSVGASEQSVPQQPPCYIFLLSGFGKQGERSPRLPPQSPPGYRGKDAPAASRQPAHRAGGGGASLVCGPSPHTCLSRKSQLQSTLKDTGSSCVCEESVYLSEAQPCPSPGASVGSGDRAQPPTQGCPSGGLRAAQTPVHQAGGTPHPTPPSHSESCSPSRGSL